MPKKTTCHRTRTMFQSAPAIAGGRCSSRCTRHIRGTCFNPRPPLLAGDARQCARAELEKYKVSIRARHCWRAMPDILRGLFDTDKVSIRARHCWRAMPVCNENGTFSIIVSIRARHCWRAMRVMVEGNTRAVFVSIRARHCWRAMRMPQHPAC